MVDRMVDSIVDVLKENGVENERDRRRHLRPVGGRRVRARGQHVQRLAGDVRRPGRQDAGRDRVPEDLQRDRRHAFWEIENEWLKPGVKESYITAKVNEYLYEHGFDFVYDIIVASGGNTSPYRRWHTDKVIRQGDLVIIDQNAVGPGGYFVDFVRCFKVDAPLTPNEQDLYKECYESMYAAIEMMKAGNTTADVAAKLPKYADDEFGTVTLSSSHTRSGCRCTRGCGSRARTRSTTPSSWRRACTSPPRPSRATRARADRAPGGEPARDQGGAGDLHQAPVLRRGAGLVASRSRQGPRHRPRLHRPRPRASISTPLGAESCRAGTGRGRAGRGGEGARGDPGLLRAGHRRLWTPRPRRLPVIARYGIGYDNVDVAAATRAGIVVTTCPTIAWTRWPTTRWRSWSAPARASSRGAAGSRGRLGDRPQASVHRIAGRRLALSVSGASAVAGGAGAGVRPPGRRLRPLRRAIASGPTRRVAWRTRWPRPTRSRCTRRRRRRPATCSTPPRSP